MNSFIKKLTITCTLIFCNTLLAGQEISQRHVPTLEELLALQTLGEIALSPDGQYLLYQKHTNDFDEDKRLLEFASACSPFVYRGDALPDSFLGDAFVCEPTANLIKRNKISEEGFMLSAQGFYKEREFLASTDERFRPISLASGPDGALYVADLYRGIIEHVIFMMPYLKHQILSRGLDKPIGLGRIYRITHEGKALGKVPRMSEQSSAELVSHLSHPNGW